MNAGDQPAREARVDPARPETRNVPRDPSIGIVEWFHLGDHARVERVLRDLRAVGASRLRTGISWADWYRPEGREWYDWLLPTLAREVELLPCFLYTPPSIGIAPKTSAPPRRPREYADVLDVLLDRYGEHFDYVELWNEPNNLSEWDWTLDPGWKVFVEMIRDAAHWARERGKKPVLGGMSPIDPAWLAHVWDLGLIDHVDAVGIHAFPGTWEATWAGWDAVVERVRRVWEGRASRPELWVTEVGYSTWNHDEIGQVERFVEATSADVDRVYWYSAHDLAPARSTVDGFHSDEREYHFGLRDAEGEPKLLQRTLSAGGIRATRTLLQRIGPAVHAAPGDHTLVTGGCGFLGTNLAARLLREGRRVHVLDSLARPGVERNLDELRRLDPGVRVTVGDIRNPHLVRDAVARAERVFHLAAQVAVTTSLRSPERDFRVNAGGTLNLLRAIADRDDPPPLLFASTNKVYGDLGDLPLEALGRRYEPANGEVGRHGISEARPLRFHSPYGCSKGAADQYVLDHARTLDLPAAVLRLSCVYGPRQMGTEDQGWVAHFLRRALEGRPITLFGDGRQVRDLLFVEDLVDAFLRGMDRIEEIRGEALNLGGGPERAVSLLELLDLIEELGVPRPPVRHADARPGDQRWYVTDLRRAEGRLGWSPRVLVPEGLQRLAAWLEGENAERPRAPPPRRAAGGAVSP